MKGRIWPWQRWMIRYAMGLLADHAESVSRWNYARMGRYGIADLSRSDLGELHIIPQRRKR
jgi:hypothetical protein